MSRRRRRWLERVERPRRDDDGARDSKPGEPVVPVVPYVPARCPRCRQVKPITYGKREDPDGRIRYHTCKNCGQGFHSQEIDPTEVA